MYWLLVQLGNWGDGETNDDADEWEDEGRAQN